MSKSVRNRKRQVIAAARGMLDFPYKLGGWGGPNNTPPYGIDCRGLVQMSFKAIGARHLIGDYSPNVRAMHKWAIDNGRFFGKGERGDVIVWHEPAKVGEPGNPLAIRHTGILIRPPNNREPAGWAISAVNPKFDVQEHTLFPMGVKDASGKVVKFDHLAVLGYIRPDWASLDVEEPPMTDPEPPVDG